VKATKINMKDYLLERDFGNQHGIYVSKEDHNSFIVTVHRIG